MVLELSCCLLKEKQDEKLSALLPEREATLFLIGSKSASQIHIPLKAVLPSDVPLAAHSVQ